MANWIARNCRLISIVEDDGLREMIQIASGDTSYNLPSRGTMSRIHTLYEGKRARRMNMLEQAKHVTLSGDHRTSVSNGNDWGITVRFTEKEWNLKSFALTVSKTGEQHYALACADHFPEVQNNGNQGKVNWNTCPVRLPVCIERLQLPSGTSSIVHQTLRNSELTEGRIIRSGA